MIRRVAVVGAAGTLFVLLLAPVATLLGRTVASGALVRIAQSPVVLEALRLSLATTAISLLIIVVLGTPLAYLLARRATRLTAIVEVVVDLPLVLPPSVAGLALLLVLGRRGVIGEGLDAVGLAIPFTTLAVIIAQVFVAAPFYVRAARAAIAGASRDLQDAARVDGASELRVFFEVTLALARPGISAGLVMSWVDVSMGYPGIGAQLFIQFKAVMLTAAWTAVVALVSLYIVKVLIGLRVAEDVEREGLDVNEHGESANQV